MYQYCNREYMYLPVFTNRKGLPFQYFSIILLYQSLISKMQEQKHGNFIDKLHYLLNKSEYSQIIRWDKTQTMIDVICEDKMEKEIIPFYFRHSKYQSFVRQLNLYGFKKIKCNGKHRFTHSQLLDGEKLQSIKTCKSNKICKKTQKQSRCSLTQQNQDFPLRNSKNEVKNSNSKRQIPEERINPSLLYQQSKPNIDLTTNSQSQLLTGFANSYFNFWNMLSMEPLQQFSAFIYINPMQTLQ